MKPLAKATSRPVLPGLHDAIEEHADWVEWAAILSGSSFTSWSDHQTDLRIASGLDDNGAIEGSAPFEVLIDDLIAELEDRRKSCGDSAYPFEIEREGLSYKGQPEFSAYTFLLGLTLLGAQPFGNLPHGERLFEDLCSVALGSFLDGSRDRAEIRVFGFPRRIEPAGFKDAVDKLCKELREGRRCTELSGVASQKDAKLDLVGWKGFADGRGSQLIVFGQCATGANWFDKLYELRPDVWCSLWMERRPLVSPVPSFFLPRRVERERWEHASRYGGILFDRCRISGLISELEAGLADDLACWTAGAVRRGRSA